MYYERLKPLEKKGILQLPYIPAECEHNAHMFYIKTGGLEERTALTAYLKDAGVGSAFHYVPLHSAPAGERFGVMAGEDRYTTNTYERLLRLPMYYGLTEEEIEKACNRIMEFYK